MLMSSAANHARPLGRAHGVVLLFLSIALNGCEAPPASVMVESPMSQKAAQEQAAGRDQVGESCTYQILNQTTAPDFARAIDLYCGKASLPSGRIFEARQVVAFDQLDSAAASGTWREILDQRFSCGEPTQEHFLSGGPAAFLVCTHRAGWPHIAFATDAGGKTYFADGVPSATPALAAAIASLSEITPPSEAERTTAALLISRKVTSKPFGSGDLEDYNQFRGLGERAFDDLDYSSAEVAYRAAVAIKEKFLGNESAGLVAPLINQALAVSNQNRFKEADGLFDRARALLAKHPDPLIQAELEFYLAAHAANQGRADEAKRGVAQAERDFATLAPSIAGPSATDAWRHIRSGEAGALANAVFITPDEEVAISGLASAGWYDALLTYRAGDYSTAEQHAGDVGKLLAAMKLNAPGFVPRSIATTALSFGREGLFSQAESGLDRAADLFERTHQEKLRAKVLFLRGGETNRRGDRAGALATFRTATKVLKQSEAGLPRLYIEPYLEVLAASLDESGADHQRLSSEMFDALQLVETSETATTVAEAFARLATEAGTKRDAVRATQDADDKLDGLFTELDAERTKPPELQDEKSIDAIKQGIAQEEEAKNAALAARLSTVPEYEQLLPTSVGADTIAHALHPEEGLLQFLVGSHGTYAVLVERDAVTAYRVGLGEAELGRKLHALRQTIEPDADGRLPPYDVAGAHELYTDLMAPIASRLAELKRLVIIPSGALNLVPMEALVTDDAVAPANGNYADIPFLLNKFVISYFPSPQNFLVQREHVRPSAATRPYIGFGGFVPARPDQLAASFPPDACKQDLDALEALSPLEGTQKEVGYIGSQIFHVAPSDIVLGAAFTRERIERTDLGQYRVVHFATHALLPTDLRCRTEPLVVLSVPANSPNAAPGFMGLRDILALKLDADLVVLSACNTGPNGQSTGDQLSALAKGFFFAGARGLLVTHWELEDRAGPILAALTLNPTSTPGGTATALRAAKLSLIRDISRKLGVPGNFYTHPFIWAPLVLIGDGIKSSDQSAELAAHS